jgi:hypothetical protein
MRMVVDEFHVGQPFTAENRVEFDSIETKKRIWLYDQK